MPECEKKIFLSRYVFACRYMLADINEEIEEMYQEIMEVRI